MKQITPAFEAVEISGSGSTATRFLYNTVPGRMMLKLLVRTVFSKIAGSLMSSPASRFFIGGFIKRNSIDMNEYRDVKYNSFNDFFIREIKEGFRPFPDCDTDVAAPCDGKLTVYTITADSVFSIKNSEYSITDLLQDKDLADSYSDGICLIFRLTPDNYHRYAYICDGEVLRSKYIKGVLHTVQPIACRQSDIFCQNTREYTVLQTKNYGKIIQMEVGALFVGMITNNNKNRSVKIGEKKGMFQFGGSTIIMLFQKDAIRINEEICENTKQNMETIVKMGNKIGEKS